MAKPGRSPRLMAAIRHGRPTQAGQSTDITVAECRTLGRHEQAVREAPAFLTHAVLQLSQAFHLREEPRRDAGHALDLGRGHAPSQQRQHPPEA